MGGAHPPPCMHDCITLCRLVSMCKCIKVKCTCRNANFSLQHVRLFAQPLTVQALVNARSNRMTISVSSSSVLRKISSTRCQSVSWVPRRDDGQQHFSSLDIHHPHLGITPFYITHISMLKACGRTHASGRQWGRTLLMSRACNPPGLPPGDLLAGVPLR